LINIDYSFYKHLNFIKRLQASLRAGLSTIHILVIVVQYVGTRQILSD
jgi:hypothetical protein